MKSEEKKLVSIGHLTKDDIVFSTGKTSFNSLGGACLYSAGGAAIFGGNPTIISVVGNSYNYEALTDIAQYANIDITRVKRINEHGIDIWVLYDNRGQHYFIPKYYSGAFDEVVPTCEMITDDLLNKMNFFHVTPMPINVQRDIVRYLVEKNCLVTLDPPMVSRQDTSFAEWASMLQQLEVFFPSEIEFESLGGRLGNSLESEITEFSNYYGVKTLVLKVAEKGAYLYLREKEELYHIHTACKNVLDCTGAGDAFAGGFLYKYMCHSDPVESLKYATVAAAVAVESATVIDFVHKGKSQVEARLVQAPEVKRLL